MSLNHWLARLAVNAGKALHPLPGCLLRAPVFLVGFNNSGKSTLVQGLAQHPKIRVFPGEGNGDLWFRGFYPWWERDREAPPPLWWAPDEFIGTVLATRPDRFRSTRSQLGVYHALRARGKVLVNDSGMLAALLPELPGAFPDARFVHLVRDGRVVSFLAAQKTLRLIEKWPQRYRRAGCPSDPLCVLLAQGRYWCWTLDRVREVERILPDAVLHIRYEDFCAEPGEALQEIARFVGVQGPVVEPSWGNRISDRNADDARDIPGEHLARLEPVVADHLQKFGYK